MVDLAHQNQSVPVIRQDQHESIEIARFLVSGCCPPPALADILSVDVPPYWTGTYNKAWATAIGGPYVRAILKVGNSVVRDYTFDDLRQHFTLSVTVDSTHFNHGQSVAVQLLVQRIDGVWFDEASVVPVKNMAFAWEHPDFSGNVSSHASEIVQDQLQDMNWNCGEDHTSNWDHSDIDQHLNGTGVHYVGSHGEELWHWTTVTTYDEVGNPIHDYVAGRDNNSPEKSYYHFRVQHMGDYNAVPPPPSPPYNPSGVPQVTFAFIDACVSGRNSGFARILYPNRIYDYMPPDPDPSNTPYAFNQAVLTWNGWIPQGGGARVNQELWSRLRAGWTVRRAREDMIQQNAQLSRTDVWLKISDTNSTNYRPVSSASDMPIWGDLFTRITGVYTGGDSFSASWWYL